MTRGGEGLAVEGAELQKGHHPGIPVGTEWPGPAFVAGNSQTFTCSRIAQNETHKEILIETGNLSTRTAALLCQHLDMRCG